MDFERLQGEFHALRKFRNRLLHSVFIEMKAGGDVVGLLRSNPKVVVDIETGEVVFDQEAFTEEMVHQKLREVADAAFRLGIHYIQLIHWSPFEQFPRQA